MADIAAVLDSVTTALGPWTYALVGVLVFMETVAFAGLLAPGEITLVAGGAAAANGAVELAPLLALVLVSGVLGDLTGFTLGRRFGWPLLAKVAPRFRLDQARLETTLSRWGGKALVAGRFIGPVRVFAPFAAGTSGMATGRLVRLSMVGVALWGGAFVLAGYEFADVLADHVQVVGNIALGVCAATAGICVVRRRFSHRRSASA